MSDKPLKYSTELTNEYFMKYRDLPAKGTLSDPFIRSHYPKLRGPFYPNDKEITTKTLDCAVYSSVFGVLNGLLMVNYRTGFRGLPNMAEVFFRHATPWVISGAVYGFVTSGSANFRKQEDFVNHLIGGLTAGSVLGLWHKNRLMAFWGSVALGGYAGVTKYLRDNDLVPPGEVRMTRMFNNYRMRTWFTDPIPVEGTENDEYKSYRP